MRAVVGRVLDDRFVGDAKLVEQVEQLPNVQVVFHHAIVVLIAVLAGEPTIFRFNMGAEVHACTVPPAEKGFACLVLAFDKVLRCSDRFIVDGFHSLFGESTGVFDLLSTIRHGVGTNDAARSVSLAEFLAAGQDEIRGIVLILRFFISVR